MQIPHINSIELTNGKGLLKICIGKLGNYYLQYHKPLSVVWSDHYGSIGQFLTVAKNDNNLGGVVNAYSRETLYTDFAINPEGAYEFLKPLIELFENGKYYFSYVPPAIERTSNNPFDYWDLHIADGIDVNNSDEVVQKHKEFLSENEISKKYYPIDLLRFSTYNFSDYMGRSFIATQPKEHIDDNRVEFFKNEISAGKRPFAITTNKVRRKGNKSDSSPNFVLDGHHKILAYSQLKMMPALLHITSISNSADTFDLEAVKDVMYPWQHEHLIKHYNFWDD
jgi:hypothetical protein